MAYIKKIDEMGGITAAVEAGYPQREIASSAYDFQRSVDSGERSIVGINKYADDSKEKIQLLKIEPKVESQQIERVKDLRARRDNAAVRAALEEVRRAARGNDPIRDNLMVAVLAAAKARVTLGEISDVFREVCGVYRDPAYL